MSKTNEELLNNFFTKMKKGSKKETIEALKAQVIELQELVKSKDQHILELDNSLKTSNEKLQVLEQNVVDYLNENQLIIEEPGLSVNEEPIIQDSIFNYSTKKGA